jgi:hypothetical protein
MRRRLLLIAILTVVPTTSLLTVAQAQNQKAPAKQKKSSEGKAQQAALTGCVDEHDGHYVLLQEQNRAVIAHLEAEGFPTEGFAKHLGHKVTVRGTASSSGAERPVFKVRSVEAVSDACGPQL